MSELATTQTLVSKIYEKTTEGKIPWEKEGNRVSANPTPNLHASFILHSETAYDAQWQKFLLFDGEDRVLDLNNPAIFRGLGLGSDNERLVAAINALFDFVILQPKRGRIQTNLDALDNL
jgi:hypothetical protein